ncbi:MAG: gliding motility-associated C-terminal domain-containing protein [Flavobacteriales bacterium]|nr:gliding motility-associated C-terminal domain-containing protein [Flavobacteriales bacterium]
MKKLISIIILGIGLAFNAQAQGTCSGDSFFFDETGNVGSSNSITIGDGTAGSIQICIDINNIDAAGCTGGSTADVLVIRESDGTLVDYYYTADGLACRTVVLADGYAVLYWLAGKKDCAISDVTISWTTIDGSGVDQCVPCTSDSECPAGMYCNSGVCDDTPCTSDSDCPSGYVCGGAGICVSACDYTGATVALNDAIFQAEIISECGTSFNACSYGAGQTGNCPGQFSAGTDFYNDLDCNLATETGGGSAGADVGYSVENDIFYQMCPQTVGDWEIEVTGSNCVSSAGGATSNGYQVSVFFGDDDGSALNTLVYGGAPGQNLTGTTTIVVNVTDITQCVFIAIDGYAGTQCDFEITVQPLDGQDCIILDPGATVLGINDTICSGQTATLGAYTNETGTTYTYTWYATESSATLLFTGPTYTTTVLTADTSYWAEVDIDGTDSPRSEVFVIVNPLPTITLTNTNASCDAVCDGTLSLTPGSGTTPYTYTWSNGPTTEDQSALCDGTYTVTIVDDAGCTVTASATITEPTPLVVTSVETSVTCNGGSNGESALTVSGGTTSYSYLWDASANNQISATATGLSANSYTVTVTDGNLSASVVSITIIEPSPLIITTTITDASCGASNGSIEITVSGGTTDYTYLWPNGQTTTLSTGLSTGTYVATITDGNSCVTAITENVSNTSFSVSISSQTNVLCNGYSTGSATVSETGGLTPFTYFWSSGQTVSAVAGVPAGVYNVTVTDNTPCDAIESVTITEPTAISISSAQADVLCNGASNGSVTVTASGGTTAYTYLWDGNANNQTTQNATGLNANTYSVTVTDANSCPAPYSVTITEPTTALSVATTCTDATTVGGTDGASASAASGGTTPYGYSWGNGQNTATATGLGAGTQAVTVTDLNGCTTTGICTVSEPICALAITLTPTNISCNGVVDGAIVLTTTGGFSPLTYVWSNGSSSQNLSGLTQNTYSVTITDNALCSITATAAVAEPAILLASTTCTDVSTVGASDGVSASGATGGSTLYQYVWSNGATTGTNTGLTIGLYTVTITDASNCTTTSSCVISDPGCIVTASASPVDISCNGANDGIASAVVSSGQTPYTYAWNDGASQTTVGASGLSSGVYSITIVDANGCITGATTTITEPGILAVSSTVTDAACGVNNGQIVTSVSGGTTAYSYNWSDGQTSTTATGLGLGTYTLTLTDVNSCSVVLAEPINNPTPNLTITSTTGLSCYGESDGSATVAASGGNTPYVYLWSNGGTNNTVTGLMGGVSGVTVSDQTPCTAIINVTVYEPSDITLTSVETDVTCGGAADGISVVSASGGSTTSYSYNWPASADNQTSASAIELSAGVYIVTVTGGSCNKYLSVTITEPSSISVTPTVTNVSCTGNSDGSIAISVSGAATPYSYLWNTAATTQSLTGLSIGFYTLTTTDNLSCSSINSYTITQPPTLVYTTSLTPVSCPGGSDGTASVAISGGVTPYTYLWDDGSTTSSVSGLPAGTILVSISDNNNCGAKTFPTGCVEITRILVDACDSPENQHEMFFFQTGPSSLDAANLTVTWPFNSWNSLCSNPTFITNTNATIAGGGVLIDPPSGIIPAGANVLIVSGDSPTTTSNSFVNLTDTVYVLFQCDQGGSAGHFSNYIVTGGSRTLSIDFGGGCTDVVSYDIDSLTMQDGSLGEENGATVSFTYGGIDTYSNDGCIAPFDPPVNSTSTIIPLTVIEIAGMILVMDSTAVNCNGDSDGTATVTISSGTTPYSYSWGATAGGQTTNTATGLSAQGYSVTATDGNGCTVIGNITVTEPLALTVSTSITQASCGASDGTATAIATGGTGTNYTYLWSDGQTTSSATGFSAGLYSVLVLDENSCPQTVSVTINNLTPIISFTDTTMITCYGGSSGAATITVTGGATPYAYSWASGSTTTSSTGLSAGIQFVTVSDNLNCATTTSVNIIEPPQLILTLDSTTVLCFGQNNGTAVANIIGGVTPYVYLWDATTGNQTSATATGLTVGSYTVTVTDDSLCKVFGLISVTGPFVLSITTSSVNNTCYGYSDGTASATALGGTTPYTYSWSNTQPNSTVTGLLTGTYSLTVTDTIGCTSIASVSIGQPSAIAITITNTSANCLNNDGAVNVSVIGTGYSYVWSNGATTASVSGLSSGTYLVSVINTASCQANGSTVVDGASTVVADFSYTQNQDLLPSEFVFTNLSTNALVYSWSFGNGETSTETNPTTTYTENGEYEITLYAYADSSLNCLDSITVSVELSGSSSLVIPIVFSPNNDGVNDLYRVNGQFIETFKATIINRWGTELYSWDRVNSTWDGRTYSGVIVPDGTYFILVEAVGADGVEYSAQKSVTLLRQ